MEAPQKMGARRQIDARRKMDAATLIDRATPEPLLVIGSVPPAGRDLDLMVRPTAQPQLERLLAANGFHRGRGHLWVRFAAGTVEIVELIPVDHLEVGEPELAQVFADAAPVNGFPALLRPAAHHRLLMAARRVQREARIDPKRRRVAADPEADEQAWQRARELAAGWGLAGALQEFGGALDEQPPASWKLRASLARLDRYRHGAVISLSGLDGSGKSTQAELLVDTLTKLGYPTVMVWTSLVAHPSLAKAAAPVRALLGQRKHPEGVAELWPPAGEDDDPATRLRERSALLGLAWVTFVATVNGWWQMRAIRPHLLRGRIVVCDRYTLDSVVHLRYRYGQRRRYRLQLALIRLFSPRPLRSYLLDVPASVARARKQEYTPAQNELRARLYREEHLRLGVERLDGERPPEELAAQIALEAWSSLCAERDTSRPLTARLLLRLGRRLART